VPAARAHGTLSPATVQAGSVQRFELTVPNDRLDADILGVALELPGGIEIESAEARQPRWSVVWDEGSVSWRGGPIARGSAETFAFTATLPAEGVAEFVLVETYDDGAATPFPIAVSVTTAETAAAGGSSDTLAAAALVIALLALLAATVALGVAIRGRGRASGT